ncbi:PopZ family protein [Hoeflea sp. YIM 152468]|uniref:PopZ family protein n=1 Tax=Hoeflea sp. YIM 152468 TaxID=3031759 RepID=UPI0023DAD21D|nr:PopZ family protein [Hoeflea sp. YIM 152468]MDF1609871.1 PopZ family protein [Hoeflea sp. YIM 152468]
MGQAGAQREPSMEEILASIRRIIENNEPGQDGNPAESESHASYSGAEDDTAAEVVADQEAGVNGSVSAYRETAAQPVSLADVAARARATPQPFSAEVHSLEVSLDIPAPGDEPALVSDTDVGSEADDAAADELREALLSDEPVVAAVDDISAAAEPVADTGAGSQAQSESESESEAEAAPAETPEDAATVPQQGGSQLISLQTGEKVAAAFGELDAAILQGQRRSFDEIAEEMLRPMLTQWLDDNLPTLVERLVREEIERVARGNRR